jgi:hypothetical protein
MRCAKLVLMLLGPAIALTAADPFVGTWKLNPAKAKYTAGTGPQQLTVTISESGSDLDIVEKGTGASGAPVSNHYTVPAKGGVGKVIEGPYDMVSSMRLNPGEQEIIFSKAGKTVFTVRSRVSKFATLTNAVNGTNIAGQTVDGVNTFEKQ